MPDAAAPAPTPRTGFKRIAIEFLLAAAIGGSAGAGFETLRPASSGALKQDEATAAPSPSGIFDLQPIVTNLGAPQDTWVRLEGSILFDPKAVPHPEAIAGKIGEDALAYLRTATLKQLEGSVGLEAMRDDLNERASVRSDGKVREFVIRTLVVQ
jgi:flagellar protein FliL